MIHPNKKHHLLTLAQAALQHLEFDEDGEIWRTGTYGRPFGNSYPQSERDVLFFAGAIKERYDDEDAEPLSEADIEYADELWKDLGSFIRDKCKLVPA